MFDLYSKKCGYVLRGLAQIGKNAENLRFRASDFCREFDLPEPFTRKALQDLVHAGILKAVQGPGGGYSLARPANQISVLDVILAVEGETHFSSCVMGFAECSAAQPCGLHVHWVRIKKKLLKNLATETVASLIRGTSKMKSKRNRCLGLKK